MAALGSLALLVFTGFCLSASGRPADATTTAVGPVAKRVQFPVDPVGLQLGGACGIIAIHGLGSLDGEYILADDPLTDGKKWYTTSLSEKNLALHYMSHKGVWSIGARGLSRAFSNGDPWMPPARSSQWQIYNSNSSSFEEADGDVSISCPPCMAVALATLEDDLAACNGPYRLGTINNAGGMFAWSHVSDERCTMIHDEAGNAIVWMVQTLSAATVQNVLASKEKWKKMVEQTGTPEFHGDNDIPRVECTSAGHTTRLVFDLAASLGSPLPIESARSNHHGGDGRTAVSPIQLASRQDASIINSAFGMFNLRISRAAAARIGHSDSLGAGFNDTADNDGLSSNLSVRITVDGVVVKTSMESAITHGLSVPLEDWHGTIVIGTCVYAKHLEGPENQAVGLSACVAEGMLVLELFSSETQVVQSRSPREATTLLSSSIEMPGGLDDNTMGPRTKTRVVFLVSLEAVDGYQLSTLHLMKHLPSNFQVSALDMTCATGDLPVEDMLLEHSLEVLRLCISMSAEDWDLVQREGVPVEDQFYAILSSASSWEDAVAKRSYIAEALGAAYRYLRNFDVLVMSNGARDSSAFLLQIARLAGVGVRQVNLGSIVGGYMSPLYVGATSLVGPSHYVAHSPAVNRNAETAGGLPVKVCRPVMDGARVVNAAASCKNTDESVIDRPGEASVHGWKSHRSYAGGGHVGDDWIIRPTKFVMVSKMEAYKTPGMFVRAMAVLQRRWATGVEAETGRRRRPEGVMVGKGPLKEHMEVLAKGLNTSIRFSGFLPIDAVPCEVQHATALIVPSISLETFGMVGPEAMILGVPVITFGFGGTGELVRHMENGLLVANPTPRALADALELLARDTRLRDRLGAQARLDAIEALSLPDMVACHAEEFLAPKRDALATARL